MSLARPKGAQGQGSDATSIATNTIPSQHYCVGAITLCRDQPRNALLGNEVTVVSGYSRTDTISRPAAISSSALWKVL